MAKMHPNAVGMTLAMLTSYVPDARTHACQSVGLHCSCTRLRFCRRG
jgi:hypothetical protein